MHIIKFPKKKEIDNSKFPSTELGFNLSSLPEKEFELFNIVEWESKIIWDDQFNSDDQLSVKG